MALRKLRDSYAIVGVGYTPQGKIPDRSALSFYVEACANAIRDAGLRKEGIPYVTAIVRLDEGPRILTRIILCDPAQLQCEMPVEVVWSDVTDDVALPLFTTINSPRGSAPGSQIRRG